MVVETPLPLSLCLPHVLLFVPAENASESDSIQFDLQVRKVAILPQDELAAFRSIPALCLNSTADGVCSARDFHNKKVPTSYRVRETVRMSRWPTRKTNSYLRTYDSRSYPDVSSNVDGYPVTTATYVLMTAGVT